MSITAFIDEQWAGDRDSRITQTASGRLTGQARAMQEHRIPSGAGRERVLVTEGLVGLLGSRRPGLVEGGRQVALPGLENQGVL